MEKQNHPHETKQTWSSLSDLKMVISSDDADFRKKKETNLITNDDYNNFRWKSNKLTHCIDLWNFNLNSRKQEFDKLKREYEEVKRRILQKSWLELSKEKLVLKAQDILYSIFFISPITNINTTLGKFRKWLIDGAILNNYELVIKIVKNPEEIVNILKNVFSIEWIVWILRWLWQSVKELLFWDAYERWKSIWELWLITTWSWAIWSLFKSSWRAILKTWLRMQPSLASSSLGTVGKSIIKTWKAIEMPYLVSQKTASLTWKWIKKASDSIWLTSALKKTKDKIWLWKPVIEIPSPKTVDKILEKARRWESLSNIESAQLIAKMEKNNPALSIFTKLKRWDYYESMIFTWIKELNDITSQAFVDRVLLKFKNEVVAKYWLHDILWNDYKNFVVKTTKDKVIHNFELSKILDSIVSKELAISEFASKVSSSKLNVISSRSRISWRTQSEIMHNIAHSRLKLERKVRWWEVMWKAEVLKYEQSLHGKYFNTNWEKRLDVTNISWWRTYVCDNIYVEKIKLNNWNTRTTRTIIFESDWWLSTDMIVKIRKWEIPTSSIVYKELKPLIDAYSARWEFISPVLNHWNTWKLVSAWEMNSYKKIIRELRSWRLSKKWADLIRKYSTYTYKKAMDKESFYHSINKSWELLFVDIKNMWSINIWMDFRRRIVDFVETPRWNKSLKYSELSEKTKKRRDIIDKSWNMMTERFVNITNELNTRLNKYLPDNKVNFHIWWDEIAFFIEWTVDSNKLNIIQRELFDILSDNLVEWRITTRQINWKNVKHGWEKLLESIDMLTKRTKSLEKRLYEIWNFLSNAKLWENEIRAKLISLSKIRRFVLEHWEDGLEYIIFLDKPFWEKNRFLLDKVMDSVWNLKESPLTAYLDTNWIWRSRWNIITSITNK